MPRVLLITYCYPPRALPGSIRPGGLAKYLPRLGWDVLVVTPELPKGARPAARVIETGYQDVVAEWKSRFRMDPKRAIHDQLNLPLSSKPNSSRLHTKIIDAAKWLIAYPDEARGWIRFAMEAVEKIVATEKVDVILTTSPPVSCHLIGARARQLLRCPWVADFRDLWTEQHYWGGRRLLQPLHKRLARKTLKSADALVTVSSPWARSLQRSYPNKRVYTITNGFDPDDFRLESKGLTNYFSITYAGYLYEGKRDPTALFEVLQELISSGAFEKSDIRVRFYGPPEAWLYHLVERYGLKEVVEINGTVSRHEALMREAESQILLLLGWSDPRETGQHTGKLFEYFGAGRPILGVGGARGVLTETLTETRAGVHALSKEQLREFLVKAYQEFKCHGLVSYHPDQAAISRYTHLEMARKFSEVLMGTLENPKMNHQLLPLAQEDDKVAEVAPCSSSGR